MEWGTCGRKQVTTGCLHPTSDHGYKPHDSLQSCLLSCTLEPGDGFSPACHRCTAWVLCGVLLAASTSSLGLVSCCQGNIPGLLWMPLLLPRHPWGNCHSDPTAHLCQRGIAPRYVPWGLDGALPDRGR